MTDTLKQRAERFSIEHNWNTGVGGTHIRTLFVESLIAEIKWAREHYPYKLSTAEYFYAKVDAWQSALDHLLACLGGK